MSEPIRLGVVMDPIAAIKYAKDSTLAMLLAAAARGFHLTYFEQSHLTLRDGVAYGLGRTLTVRPDANDWFTLGESRLETLGDRRDSGRLVACRRVRFRGLERDTHAKKASHRRRAGRAGLARGRLCMRVLREPG